VSAAPRVTSVHGNGGTNPFTGKTCISSTICMPSIATIKSLLMQQRQVIMRQEKRGDYVKTHMVITGVREGHNKPIPNHREGSYTVVGFSILPDNYGELVTCAAPAEIYVTDAGTLAISDVRRINYYHKIEAVKWLSVTLHGGVKTVVKAHDLQQNAEGLLYYKLPGGFRQWHGTHFIIDPEKTKESTQMMLREHFNQLCSYENTLLKGTRLKDKKNNEYLVLQTFPARDVNGKYVDMLIVDGSMSAPIYAFSYNFQVIPQETK